MPPIRRSLADTHARTATSSVTDAWKARNPSDSGENEVAEEERESSEYHFSPDKHYFVVQTEPYGLEDYFPPAEIEINPPNQFKLDSVARDPNTASIALTLAARSAEDSTTMQVDHERPCLYGAEKAAFDTLCTVLRAMPSEGKLTDGVRFRYLDRSVEAFRGPPREGDEGSGENGTWSAIISGREVPNDKMLGPYTVRMPDEKDRSGFGERFKEVTQSVQHGSALSSMLPDQEMGKGLSEEVVRHQMSNLSIGQSEASQQKVYHSFINHTKDTGYENNMTAHHHFTIYQNVSEGSRETNESIPRFFDQIWVPKMTRWGTLGQLGVVNDIATASPVEVDKPKITKLTAWT